MSKLSDLLPPLDLGDVRQFNDVTTSMLEADLWEAEFEAYQRARRKRPSPPPDSLPPA
ncbi:MAG: hypothetical protein V4662_17770 [Verrucomicrobiota bacterium]